VIDGLIIIGGSAADSVALAVNAAEALIARNVIIGGAAGSSSHALQVSDNTGSSTIRSSAERPAGRRRPSAPG